MVELLKLGWGESIEVHQFLVLQKWERHFQKEHGAWHGAFGATMELRSSVTTLQCCIGASSLHVVYPPND